jgi:LemA protein
MTIIYILLGVVVVIGLWVIYAYNLFVRLKNRVLEGWADIDVQLKRRYDLIPNLVETVKGYAKHESGTLSAVTEMRAKATQIHVDPANITPEQITAMAGAEQGLSQSLGKLLAISENYPDLKANENFVELQRELSDTENKIQAARRFYNSVVQEFNVALESFPTNIIGNMFKFAKREFFSLGEDEQAAKDPVKVSF